MRKKGLVVALAASLVVLSSSDRDARAGGMANGLAVAVTADGSRLVAGGSNRVIYELDPKTLEVKGRTWIGRQIMSLLFSPDGKTLVVESTSAVQWLDAATFEQRHVLEDADSIRAVPARDAVAMTVRGRQPAVVLYGFGDAKEKARVPFDVRHQVAGYGVSPDGKQVAVLFKRRKDDTEEKIAWADMPEALKKSRDARFVEFQQQHDGMASEFLIQDLEAGEPSSRMQLWFSAADSNNLLYWRGTRIYVVGYQNQCAAIDAEGKIEIFLLGNGFNYAFYATPDGGTLWSGGARVGTRTRVEDRKPVAFQIDELKGFPEHYKAFATAADGTGFAGTTAFRVVRIGADGVVRKTAPVY